MNAFFLAIPGLIFVLGHIRNIQTIVRGTHTPPKMTWIIWTLVDAVTVIEMQAEGVLNAQIIAAVCGATAIAGFSLKYGSPGWNSVDLICLGIALAGIGIWRMLQNPFIGLLMSLGASTVGMIPLWIHVWKEPEKQDQSTWLIYQVSSILAVAFVPTWTFAHAIQPIVFLFLNTVLLAILYARLIWRR